MIIDQAAQQERIKRFLQHISIVGKKIYQIISQGPITKPQLRKRLSLPSKQLDDQLSALSSYNLIKALKKGGQKRGVNIWVIWSYAQGQQGQIKREGSQDVIQLILKKDSNIIQLKKQAIKNAYSLQGFNQILQMLKMKGEIFIEGQQIKLRKMKKLNIPCITCQLKSQCGPNNIINPNQCPYLLNW